jgi:hypothetical protein
MKNAKGVICECDHLGSIMIGHPQDTTTTKKDLDEDTPINEEEPEL